MHRFVWLVAALLATLGSASAQTTGTCSDASAAERRSSPIVLHFDAEQSALRADDEKKLAQLARLARSNQVQEICVQGFADLRGDPAMTERLSVSRGQAVASVLSRHGVDPRTIVIDPNGASRAARSPAFSTRQRASTAVSRFASRATDSDGGADLHAPCPNLVA